VEKLSIIIPAYNEAKTIRRVVEKIFSVSFPLDYEIIIIDDHSRDRTYRIVKLLNEKDISQRIRLLHNDINRGKGYCIRKGFEAATGSILIVQDADFEYDPSEIPKLLEPILKNECDVIYGSRFLGKARPEGMAFANWIANVFLTRLTNLFYGERITDMETCYKVMRRSRIQSIRLSAKRFDFEPEITAKLMRQGLPIREIPISYHGRTVEEGKKIKARDFFIAIWALVYYRFFD